MPLKKGLENESVSYVDMVVNLRSVLWEKPMKIQASFGSWLISSFLLLGDVEHKSAEDLGDRARDQGQRTVLT